MAVTLKTNLGDLKIELACSEAPKTCKVNETMGMADALYECVCLSSV